MKKIQQMTNKSRKFLYLLCVLRQEIGGVTPDQVIARRVGDPHKAKHLIDICWLLGDIENIQVFQIKVMLSVSNVYESYSIMWTFYTLNVIFLIAF